MGEIKQDEQLIFHQKKYAGLPNQHSSSQLLDFSQFNNYVNLRNLEMQMFIVYDHH